MSAQKIDIYNHVMPRAVADLMLELAPSMTGMVKRVTSIPMLHDIEARIRMMEAWPGYQQVLTISNPNHSSGLGWAARCRPPERRFRWHQRCW